MPFGFIGLPPVVGRANLTAANAGVSASYRLLVALYDDATPRTVRRYCCGPDCASVIVNDGVIWQQMALTGTYYNAITDYPTLKTSVLENEITPTDTIILPELSFSVSRSEDDLETWLYNVLMTVGVIRTVTVAAYVLPSGEELDVEDHLVFLGYLTGDSVRITAKAVELTAKSMLARIDDKLPRRTFGIFNSVTGRKVDPDAVDEPLPICYGDWTDDESNYQLAMRLTDTTLDANLRAQLCDPGLYGVGKVADVGGDGYVKWTDSSGEHRIKGLTGIANCCFYSVYNSGVNAYGNYTGEIIVRGTSDLNLLLNPEGDTGTAHGDPILQPGDLIVPSTAYGLRDDQGDLIENPVKIIESLLVELMGLDSTQIDRTSFDAQIAAKSTLKFRCFVDKETTYKAVLAGLLRDSGLVMSLEKGKVTLAKNLFIAGATTAEKATALQLTKERANYTETVDLLPDFMHFYGIKISYKRNPLKDSYERAELIEREGITQADRDTGKLLTIESDFIYRKEEAWACISNLAQQLLVSKPRALEVSIPHGLELNTTSLLCWSGGQENGNYYWVTSIEKNYRNSLAEGVQSLFIDTDFNYAVWVNDQAPDYDDALPSERDDSGFWLSGITDVAARYSRWGAGTVTPGDQGQYTDTSGNRFEPLVVEEGDEVTAQSHNLHKEALDFLTNLTVAHLPAENEPGPREIEGQTQYVSTVPIAVFHEGGVMVPFWKGISDGATATILNLADYAGITDISTIHNRLVEIHAICQPVDDLDNGPQFPAALAAGYELHEIGWFGDGQTLTMTFLAFGENTTLTFQAAGDPVTGHTFTVSYDKLAYKAYAWIAGYVIIHQELATNL